MQAHIEYLGHVITDKGISVDPNKISAVKNWDIPKSIVEAQSFSGLCKYYRRFVKDFVTIATP